MRMYIQEMGNTAALPNGQRKWHPLRNRAQRLRCTPPGRGPSVAGQVEHRVGHHAARGPHRGRRRRGDAEGLVQIQVVTSPPNCRERPRLHRAFMLPVHIATATVAVDQRTQLFDRRFKHAVALGR